MINIPQEVSDFLIKQAFVIVSTLDAGGCIHNSCKGIVKIDEAGDIYLLDLYQKHTLENLKKNSCISITSVDEHSFCGYCLKGRARIVSRSDLTPDVAQAWEEKIISRITKRVFKNVRGEPGHPSHPEAAFPKPQYMIIMEVEAVVDLIPAHLKQGGSHGK
jgi:hypothetical protein